MKQGFLCVGIGDVVDLWVVNCLSDDMLVVWLDLSKE